LYADVTLPQPEDDLEAFWAALNAGALDACLSHLRRAGGRAAEAPANCRLAEALFHSSRRDAALECARRALPWVENTAADLRICAWVFSNCGCYDEAAAAYRGLIELCPDWVEGHRHASGALATIGRIDEAVAHALMASDGAPHNPEFALHAGSLLLGARRADDAARYFDRAVSLEPGSARAWCGLSAAYCEIGQREEAIALALRSAALASSDIELAIDAAEMLLRCGRANDAAEVLSRASADAADPRLFRVLSAAEMVQEHWEAALAAVDRALAEAPDAAEYHLHRGHLLCRFGDLDGAALALDRAAALDPTGRDLKRAQLSLFFAAGLVNEATAVGGELLQRFPDDKEAAAAVLHLLTQRLDTIDGEYVVLHDSTERMPRPPRPPPGLLARLRTQQRVIGALVIRETRTRFADSKLGYGWALLEPILHITLLSATFSALMHGQPPIGTHFFLFYYTGLIPYLIFVHTSSGMSHAITSNGPVLQLPLITTFDVIAARGLLEIATDVIVAVILLAGFGAMGLAAMPDDLWGVSMALLVTAAFGCGVGYINAVVTVFLRSWEKAYSQLTRILYFVSGIFYVPGMMPDWARDILAWNPLLHAIDWFRAGFFDGYQPHWLDRPYLVVLAIMSLLTGFGLERGLRRRLSTPL
jgi:ABC-type polysaccharide/polyol phosphate export permease/Flp pilus assembly protein TadD